MSQKLEQLILLFDQLEAWDMYPTWIEKEGGLFEDFNRFNLYGLYGEAHTEFKTTKTHFVRDMDQYYASKAGIKSNHSSDSQFVP